MEYLIAGKKFKFIEYGDLTPKKELLIDAYLNIDKSKSAEEMNINAANIFPLLLVPIDETPLDISDISYNQMIQIIIDYKAARQAFTDKLIEQSNPT
jgi:hypothetical protein